MPKAVSISHWALVCASGGRRGLKEEKGGRRGTGGWEGSGSILDPLI